MGRGEEVRGVDSVEVVRQQKALALAEWPQAYHPRPTQSI